jgi:hypothetical protein
MISVAFISFPAASLDPEDQDLLKAMSAKLNVAPSASAPFMTARQTEKIRSTETNFI